MFHGSHPPFAEPLEDSDEFSDPEYDSDIPSATLRARDSKKRLNPSLSTSSTVSQPIQSFLPQYMYAHEATCIRLVTMFLQPDTRSFQFER
jgi:hypothetical protein